ncbi:MAG TPA: phage holin family protein [Kofleriaceae bacterium]|nr:phage holin family protein [Kofleriaceae bacterium]
MDTRLEVTGDSGAHRALRVPPADPDASVGELVAGAAKDSEHMLGKYFELAKLDAKKEITRAKHAAMSIGVGAAAVGLGGMLLSFAAVWLLAMVLPLVASFAIVGGALALFGGLWLSRDRSDQLEIKIKALDEARQDLQWINENR